MLEVLNRSKVMTLQEKGKIFDIYCTLKSAVMIVYHFEINESSLRTTVKKEKAIREAITAATSAGTKTLHFL